MAPYPIETATPSDARRVAEMFLADMRDLAMRPSEAAMRDTAKRLIDDDRSHVWVLRHEGVAAAVLVATEFLSIKYPGRALWIEELYVDPAHRRGGMGRALVEHLLDWAAARGCSCVDLEAYRMNTAASVLYRSLGFRRLARERYVFDVAELSAGGDE